MLYDAQNAPDLWDAVRSLHNRRFFQVSVRRREFENGGVAVRTQATSRRSDWAQIGKRDVTKRRVKYRRGATAGTVCVCGFTQRKVRRRASRKFCSETEFKANFAQCG
ncbi:hypothetical protein AnigIFM59636_009414 [Aspergillus niger]|nr:hypothetical protein AnigIFM59636_009414 [Aspergillus niger]